MEAANFFMDGSSEERLYHYNYSNFILIDIIEILRPTSVPTQWVHILQLRSLLILYSRVNLHLVRAAESVAGVTFHDLYEEYPEFDIDVEREQRLLEAHDIIVLQHPVFWYSTPALLKQWEDLVLEHGWAYGTDATALVGKRILNAMTTGGREQAYSPEGLNRFSIRQLFRPLEQTFRLCGMQYLPPFVAHGTHRMGTESAQAHAEDYRRLLEALRDDRIDWRAAERSERLNDDLDALLRGPT